MGQSPTARAGSAAAPGTGVGGLLGPLLGGAAVSLGDGSWSSAHGDAAVRAVCGAGAPLSVPFLRRGRSDEVAQSRRPASAS